MFNLWTYFGRSVIKRFDLHLQFDAISPSIALSSAKCRLMISKPSIAHNGHSRMYVQLLKCSGSLKRSPRGVNSKVDAFGPSNAQTCAYHRLIASKPYPVHIRHS
ncbi:hypothetical protein HanRHA438_Chr17g0816931 [Helianthus annuus]|nr:hypothetical protein HanRHA438_Chr17g0816931 [Helianthus annuus]